MKKKKQTEQKPKEFASRPLAGALKGVRTERAAESPPKGVKVEPPPEVAPDEAEMFLRAVGDVRTKRVTDAEDEKLFLRSVGDARRLHAEQEPQRGKSALRQGHAIDEAERAVFLKALESLQLDKTFRDRFPAEEETGRPLPVNRLRQLKRGTIRLDLELDLHGLTREEALQSLAQFIAKAWERGQKAVLVITGKGNRSPGEPVLQGAVSGWLRDRGKGMVAEFAPAPREYGGGGAFVVFLKEKT